MVSGENRAIDGMIQCGDGMFALGNGRVSYVLRVGDGGVVEHVHFGGALSEPLELAVETRATVRHASTTLDGTPHLYLADRPQEYPTFGSTDTRQPALVVRQADGSVATVLRYHAHRVEPGRPDMDGLPGAGGDGAETLVLSLRDTVAALDAELRYTIWPDHAVIARSVRLTNRGETTLVLDQVASASLDLPETEYDLLHLHGSWAREFSVERLAAPQGRFSIGSARGTSSAAHNPYLCVLERSATENHGRVFGTTLVYSGNHEMSAARGEFGGLRLQAGLNPLGFSWRLAPGERFTTPEALLATSESGLGGLSDAWHGFIRAHITPKPWRGRARPTYLNSWEAAYFDIDEAAVLALADVAADVGVDMVVLDDGWFAGRRDDRTSLGDWQADPERFPSGLGALGEAVRARGLRFGVWLEPEMVSPDSDLFRTHPDWALGVPGRTPSLGRHQRTLDLSRQAVQDHVFEAVDRVLSTGVVDYIKWDMNRNMAEVGSTTLPPEQQGEVAHRYMLGLYQVLERLTARYPGVLFEACASGGNRFDLGMLRYMAQGWVSDGCDPITRLGVVGGASHLYPLDTMAAYVGPSPNHQNGRAAPLDTRYLAGAFCAARGLSLSPDAIRADRERLAHWVAWSRDNATDMIGGRFRRLGQSRDRVVWQLTSADETTVYVLYVHVLSDANQPFRRIRLADLAPGSVYREDDSNADYHGDALMQRGLPLPLVSTGARSPGVRYMPDGDFSAALFVLRRQTG